MLICLPIMFAINRGWAVSLSLGAPVLVSAVGSVGVR